MAFKWKNKESITLLTILTRAITFTVTHRISYYYKKVTLIHVRAIVASGIKTQQKDFMGHQNIELIFFLSVA